MWDFLLHTNPNLPVTVKRLFIVKILDVGEKWKYGLTLA